MHSDHSIFYALSKKYDSQFNIQSLCSWEVWIGPLQTVKTGVLMTARADILVDNIIQPKKGL